MRALPKTLATRRVSLASHELTQTMKDSVGFAPISERGDSAPSLLGKRIRDSKTSSGNDIPNLSR